MFAFFLALVMLAIAVVFRRVKPGDQSNPGVFKTVSYISFVLFLIFLASSVTTVVPPGNVGVPVTFGSVGQPLSSGLNFVSPVTSVVDMSIQTKDYTMSSVSEEGRKVGDDAVLTLSRDQLTLRFDVTVWYRLDASQASNVYKNVGENYDEVIVRPAIRTSLVNAATKFDASDVMSLKRDEYTKTATDFLLQELQGKGVILDRILVRNVYPPDVVSNAIASKLKAAQDAQAMEYTLQYAQKEAQRKAIEAQGISEAQKIINSGLTQQYLQWYYITQLKELVNSPNNTVLILPYDQKLTPMFNIPTKK